MSVKIVYLPRRIKDPKDKTGHRKINGKDGFLYIRYIYQSKPTYFKTGIDIRPDRFNYDKQKINYIKGVRKDLVRNQDMVADLKATQDNHTFIIEAKLAKVKRVISDLKREGIEPTGVVVKSKILNVEERKNLSQNIPKLLKEYLGSPIMAGKRKGQRRTDTSKEQIISVFKNLFAYFEIKGIPNTLESFDKKFYGKYTYFLEYERSDYTDRFGGKFKNMKVNSIGNQIDKIKSFLNWVSKEYNYSLNLDLSDMAVIRAKRSIVYLTENEIAAIIEHDLSNDYELSKARDLFVLHCRIGLRYSDLSRLGPEHIKGNTIELRTQKAGTNTVVPLVSPDAMEIINRYKQLPKITQKLYNVRIKKVCMLAGIDQIIEVVEQSQGKKIYKRIPKYRLMSPHKAVATFITLSAQKGIPIKTIAQIVGKTTQVISKHYLGDTDKETIQREMIAAYGKLSVANDD